MAKFIILFLLVYPIALISQNNSDTTADKKSAFILDNYLDSLSNRSLIIFTLSDPLYFTRIFYYKRGTVRELYEDIQLAKGDYLDFKKHNFWRLYNGSKYNIFGFYKEGKKHGAWTYLTPKGKKYLVINYEMDSIAGPAIKYDDNKNATEIELTNSEIVTTADQNPEFPGGLEEFNSYIKKTLIYPPLAIKTGKQGTVMVEIVIDRQGYLYSAKPLNEIGGGLEEEAIRVIYNMPRWQPAFTDGIPVNYSFKIPISFNYNASANYSEEIQGDIYTSGSIVNGSRSGLFEFFKQDTIAFKGYYYKGKKTGKWQYYYTTGSLMAEVNFEEDLKNGISKSYYEDGLPKCFAVYDMDLLKSEVGYYENGNIKYSIQYKDYRPEGELILYYPNGNVQKKLFYSNGKLISVLNYYSAEESVASIDSLPNGTGKILYYDDLNTVIFEEIYEEGKRTNVLDHKDLLSKYITIYDIKDQNGHQKGNFLIALQDNEETEINLLPVVAGLINYESIKYASGEYDLHKYLQDNIEWPLSVMTTNRQGIMEVEFTIDEAGTIDNFVITKSIDPDFDIQIITLFGMLKRFSPAYKNGIPLKTKYRVPIIFYIRG